MRVIHHRRHSYNNGSALSTTRPHTRHDHPHQPHPCNRGLLDWRDVGSSFQISVEVIDGVV